MTTTITRFWAIISLISISVMISSFLCYNIGFNDGYNKGEDDALRGVSPHEAVIVHTYDSCGVKSEIRIVERVKKLEQ